MERMKEIVEEILQLNHSLRFVGILDINQNTLYSKHVDGKTSLISEHEEEKFALDLKTITTIQSGLNSKLGKVVFSHVIRENVQQLVFQVEHVIFYVTCEPDVEHNTMVEISKLINDTIKFKFEKLQLESTV